MMEAAARLSARYSTHRGRRRLHTHTHTLVERCRRVVGGVTEVLRIVEEVPSELCEFGSATKHLHVVEDESVRLLAVQHEAKFAEHLQLGAQHLLAPGQIFLHRQRSCCLGSLAHHTAWRGGGAPASYTGGHVQRRVGGQVVMERQHRIDDAEDIAHLPPRLLYLGGEEYSSRGDDYELRPGAHLHPTEVAVQQELCGCRRSLGQTEEDGALAYDGAGPRPVGELGRGADARARTEGALPRLPAYADVEARPRRRTHDARGRTTY